MKRVAVIIEEKLTDNRYYEIEVENDDELKNIIDEMLEADELSKPSEFIPEKSLISYSDELDYSSPENIEYEFFDDYVIEGDV